MTSAGKAKGKQLAQEKGNEKEESSQDLRIEDMARVIKKSNK